MAILGQWPLPIGPLIAQPGYGGSPASAAPTPFTNSANTPRPPMGGTAGMAGPRMPGWPQAQSPAGGGGRPNPITGPLWQPNVTATINNQPTSFATPSNPNTNYATPGAAGQLAQLLGAKLVQQNLSGLSSPGSGAPSQPMQGLDFGVGDIQDPGMGLFQLQRGDNLADVQARYRAGIAPNSFPGAQPGVAPDFAYNGMTPRTGSSATGLGLQALRDFVTRQQQPQPPLNNEGGLPSGNSQLASLTPSLLQLVAGGANNTPLAAFLSQLTARS